MGFIDGEVDVHYDGDDPRRWKNCLCKSSPRARSERPKRAKFSVLVVVITSFAVGLLISTILLIFRKQYLSLFVEKEEVIRLVYKLIPVLALSIIVNVIQLALSGVAIGAGWQALVGYVNLLCYYVFGIPLGLGTSLNWVCNLVMIADCSSFFQGIWYGMLAGTTVQMLTLFVLVYRTNWKKEASVAAKRIRVWGREPENEHTSAL